MILDLPRGGSYEVADEHKLSNRKQAKNKVMMEYVENFWV